jgi:predicted aldo/keto reductase-like oxidoreductase
VHAVNAWADLEQVLAPDGVVAGLQEARDQGLVRFIGITGHARPELLAHALERHAFDTVLVALGMADRLVTSPETFLLPVAQRKDVGVIAMKVFGHGTFTRRDLALRYSLGLPGVSLAIVGMDDVSQIDANVELTMDIQPLSADEEEELVEHVRPLVERDATDSQEGQGDLFWLHDTKVMGWQEHDEPVLVRY